MKKLQKPISVLLSLIMIFSIFTIAPFEAGAVSGVSYIERSWDGEQVIETSKTSGECTVLSEDTDVDLSEGWYVLREDVTLTDRLMIDSGTVDLILCDGATLTANRGVGVGMYATLNIYGQRENSGKIAVTMTEADSSYAAIGGTDLPAGDINIHGGTMDLTNNTSAVSGAGIGGCASCSVQTVSIYGGTIKATASSGAGIGGGRNAAASNNAGKEGIRIYGGTIEAKSTSGAGIGNGRGYDNSPGSIAIYGGTVKASSVSGAGIGGGYDGRNGLIDIYGGDIVAVSTKYGAGIGSGETAAQEEAINIHGGSVYAQAVTGAGIGAGRYRSSSKINITGGIVVAGSSSGGAGIGGGVRGGLGNKGGDAAEINISDATVVAAASNLTQQSEFEQIISYGGEAAQAAMTEFMSDLSDFSVGNVFELIGNFIVGLFDSSSKECFGAGIGAGAKGHVGTINISGSNVTATGGTQSAGIGSSKENSFDAINITDSTVSSKGGENGAGIGSGNKASGNGSIYISGSAVKADGGSDSAAIGTGNESPASPGTIEILGGSDVTAHGGAYGAGIGGGDAVSGGTIKISGSVVKAYGGQDGAGIGGGEDGQGGHVEILNGSDVYAEGKQYGAGIGGGEDASGEYCEIDSDCVVEAIAGGGNGASIGHGDCGWYVVKYSSGRIVLGNRLKVKAGSSKSSASVYRDDARFKAIWNNKYARIYVCDHDRTEWRGKTSAYHTLCCADCGLQMSETEPHDWDSSDTCTICGISKTTMDLTFIEKDADGQEIRTVKAVFGSDEMGLPECEHTPDGYGFLEWKINYYGFGDHYHAPGDYFVPSQISPYVEAIYVPLKETTYIDEVGMERTVMAKQISAYGMDQLELLSGGWYVVDANLQMADRIRISGDVHIIIEDGCSLKADNIARILRQPPIWHYPRDYAVLYLYGQKNQTGVFDTGSYSNCVAELSSFYQYGAAFSAFAATFEQSCAVYAGKYSTLSDTTVQNGSLGIYGGNVYLARADFNGEYGVEFGWTKPSDRIELATFVNRGPVNIQDGQAFIDDDGTIYRDRITIEQQDALSANLNDKTLRPYIEHSYGEPEWVWSDDGTNATAVFTCTDEGCGDVQKVEARVTVTEDGDCNNCHAVCTFMGEEYTDDKRVKVLFDITVTDTGHGSVTPDKTKAKAGDDVYLSFAPDSGYVVDSVTATGADGEVYTDGYSFEMPASDVTVTAAFTATVPMKEPYIDENGAYILGNIEYCVVDGVNHAVNEDGTVGAELDDVSLSYFEFELLSDDTYLISQYTGPGEDLTELVIPKTFNGKKITAVGSDRQETLIKYDEGETKTQFSLTLNENITKIGQYSFYTLFVTKVDGDTSALKNIGNYAFSWANSPGGYTLDIRLDYPGRISVGSSVFNHMKVTAHLRHATTFSSSFFGAQSMTYDFTDAHPYGEPDWSWAEDYSAATATFTCTDNRCKHQETLDAAVVKTDAREKTTYTASVTLDDKTYTDEKIAEKGLYGITIAQTVNGTVTADLETAYEGEEVALNVTPDEKYMLYSLTVVDADGLEIEVTDDYKFTMPASDVTVTAIFARTYMIGDADGDGNVTIVDATVIQRRDIGLKVDYFDVKAADVDGNGSVEILDVTLIRRCLANIEIPYEIGKTVVEEPA